MRGKLMGFFFDPEYIVDMSNRHDLQQIFSRTCLLVKQRLAS